jgi:hypothetical protein
MNRGAFFCVSLCLGMVFGLESSPATTLDAAGSQHAYSLAHAAASADSGHPDRGDAAPRARGSSDAHGRVAASKPGAIGTTLTSASAGSHPRWRARIGPKNAVDDARRWDPQFGQAIGCDGEVLATEALADGRVVLAGRFEICGNVEVNRVAIWEPATGSFAALGSGVVYSPLSSAVFVADIAIEGSNVYFAGLFDRAGAAQVRNVARYNIATQEWSALGTGLAAGANNSVFAIAIAGSDIYLGGGFTEAGGLPANRVARFSTATLSWAALGSGALNGVDGTVQALAVDGSSVYAGGNFAGAGGVAANSVARYHAASNAWSALGESASNGVGPFGTVNAIAISTTDVFVAGFFRDAGGIEANNIARFGKANQVWSALATGGVAGVAGSVGGMTLAAGSVFVAGGFATAGGVAAENLARFDLGTQSWSRLGAATTIGISEAARAVAVVGTDVYVGGSFILVGGSPANRVARFSVATQAWSPLGAGAANGLNSGAYAMLLDGPEIVVRGNFTQAGVVSVNGVARFDPATGDWARLGTAASNGAPCPPIFVPCESALALQADSILLGGAFVSAGQVSANRVARYDKITGVWSALGSGAANGVNSPVLAVAVAGDDVYVGGLFSEAGGAPAASVARFNAATQAWGSLGAGTSNGVNGRVDAIAIDGVNVYVGGGFTTAGGLPANRIARFNIASQTWSSLGEGASNGTNDQVREIVVVDGIVYVGGDFTAAGGNPASRVARFDPATQAWSTLGTGAANGVTCAGTPCVGAMAVAGSLVYVGGNFTQAGGAAANRIARFDTNALAWSTLGRGVENGVDGFVDGIGIAGSNVYLAGTFRRAGTTTSLRIARFDNRRETIASASSLSGTSVVVNSSVALVGTITTTSFPVQPGTVEFIGNGIVIPGCADQPLVGGLDTRSATCSAVGLRVGAQNIVARYKGDSLNFLGTSDTIPLQVLPPSFTYNLATLPGATFGAAGYSSGTIAVSSAAGTGVLGPVSFQVVDAAQLPPGLTATPQANGLLIGGTPTQAGSFTFTVRATDSSSATVGGPFSGDRQYTIVVARATQAITPITRVDAVPLDNGVAFADGDFAVQASASSGLPVSIDSTTPLVCQVVAPAFTVQPLQIGTCTLRARQIGNGNYEAAPEVLRTFQVKATPDLIVDSAPNPSLLPVGAMAPDVVVLTATVASSASGAPTGTVRFQRAGNTIAGCAAQPVAGFGGVSTATCSTTSVVRGANTITAQYSGDALNIAATSNVHTHQLNVVTAAGIATITPSPCVVGEACTVAVAVAASPAASGTPPGSVQVGSSTGGSCTVTLASGGGSCALTATTAGTGTVTATYLGSPPWLASPAATQSHPFVATVDELFVDGFEPAPAGQPVSGIFGGSGSGDRRRGGR